MNKFTIAAAVLAATSMSAPLAQATSGFEVGTLKCSMTDVDNYVVYSEQMFACTFEGTNGETEAYIGEIDKLGIDLSVKTDITMVWTVVAASEIDNAAASLAGTYVGGGADVAIGNGVGAKVLIGGGDNSLTLQPVSVSGIDGTGAAIGIESFKLK